MTRLTTAPARRAWAGLLLTVLLAAGVWAGVREVAQAHAILVRSSPEAGAELQAPPGAIDLWFSEPLEPAFSTFELLDSTGTPLPLDAVEVDARDPHHMSGLPRGLSPGYYTVLYENVSQSDGHEWSGAYSFTVLNEDGSLPSGAAFSAGDLGRAVAPGNVAGRWLSFMGFALLSGGAVLYLPLRHVRGRTPRIWAAYRRTSARVALAGLPLALAGAVLVLMAQTDAVRGAGVLDVLDGTRAGMLWLWRILAIEVAAVLVLLAFLAGRQARPRAEGVALALLPVAAAGGLLTISLLSHAAAAPGSTWALVADYAHLLVASWWLGGVAVLAVLLTVAFRRERVAIEEARAVLVPFSIVAAVSVYALVATGIIRALGEVPTVATLWETGYGRWLLVKLGLVAGTLGVAFFNRRHVEAVRKASDRVSRSGGAGASVAGLRRLLPVELVLGAAILLAVGALGQTPTPRGSAVEQPSQAVQPFNGIQQADEVTVHLQVTPAVVGLNDFRVHLYTAEGEEPEGVGQVRLTFLRPGLPGGEQVAASPEGRGIYNASSTAFSQDLTWTVQVDVTRSGADDTRLSYDVPVSPAGAGGSRSALGSPAPQLEDHVVLALVAVLAGAGLVLLGPRRASSYRTAVHAAGVVLLGGGLLLGVAGGGEDERAFASNPTPGDSAAIARGQDLYMQYCQTCHGAQGRGDGPGAAGLTPPPADLRQHIPLHRTGRSSRSSRTASAGRPCRPGRTSSRRPSAGTW